VAALMRSFIGRRLLNLIPVLLAVTLLTFLIASLLPGDLAYVMLGDQATPEEVAGLRHDMGLDLPIWQRYLHWLAGVLQGDLGRSFRTGQTVLAAISERLPVSLELMVLAELIGLAVGIPLAILCAVRAGGTADRMLAAVAFGKLSLPSFMVGILLIYVFAVSLRWLPATGYVRFADDPLGNLGSFVLPAATLAFGEWPVLMRVLRSDMIATLQEDYIAMARAKGLKPARILLVHALKPSSLTLVTVTGINVGRLIGGALIVETIFALPGIGRLLVGAIYARDFIILQGVVLFVAAGFVIVNFIVDLLYAFLDPRIRHGRA
jgi:peptide/nickel transport system permease protein